MVDLSWSCLNPEKQIQCAQRIVNILSTYPIILEWKFSYIKKLIDLIENCEKNYKQTCSKQKIPVQDCQLSRIIRKTPDFELFLPVSRLESEISRIIAEVCHFL